MSESVVKSETVAVDRREIRARMDLPMTQLLIDRGCDKEMLRFLIEQRLQDVRRDFESATEMLLAYMAAGANMPSLSKVQEASFVGR